MQPSPPESPEIILDRATPEQVLKRLAALREQHAHGLMTTALFRELLTWFRFTDDSGQLWAPGANTNQWYRWTGAQWTPDEPPAALNLPSLPPSVEAAWQVSGQVGDHAGAPPGREQPPPAAQESPIPAPPDLPRRPDVCPTCGASMPGKKFCTQCGTATSAAPAGPAPAGRCLKCGAPASGTKFCTQCGTPLA